MAHITEDHELVRMGYGGYLGWGEAEAWADFNAGHGEGKRTSGSSGHGDITPTQSAINPSFPTVEEYIDAITETLPEPKPKYSEVNPFFFDEEAARELATAEFSPYYDEIIQDYMSDVATTKKRIGDDTATFLAEMEEQKESFMDREGTKLERLLRGIKEGFSQQGLYFSGKRQLAEMETEERSEKDIADYMKNYGYRIGEKQTEAQQSLEDIATRTRKFKRDTERERDAAITGHVQQLKSEAIDEYLMGMNEYYSQPNWINVL
jgi:hypothetical protein